MGSSPHARGARKVSAGWSSAAGIIPACAGSTCQPRVTGRGAGDHPRMRGEHLISSSSAACDGGSSPHARGAQMPRRENLFTSGIIPACAGSTRSAGRSRGCGRDHPRMRGEHGPTTDAIWPTVGSSPHARGALKTPSTKLLPHGIIPACAGSTGCPTVPARTPGDHPRMRGEHFP